MQAFIPLEIKKILFGQLFLSGLQAASGVIGLALLFYFLGGENLALGAVSGVICVSVVDIPSPRKHKFFELLLAVLLTGAGMYVMILCRDSVWTTGVAVLVISFLAAMLVSYGKKAMPLSFSLFFVIVMALGKATGYTEPAEIEALHFMLGSVCYMAYALLVSSFSEYRNKQQMLADSLFALAKYLRVKAAFYEADADLDACYGALVDKQQAARDFVFRNIRNERDAQLARIFLGALDIYEYILSSHTDYRLLQQHYAGTDLLMFLRDLSEKAAQDMEGIAYSNLRNRETRHPINYAAELMVIEHEIERLGREAANDADRHALAVLSGTRDRIRMAINSVQQLHMVMRTRAQVKDVLGGLDLKPFLTPVSANPRVLLDQLNLGSPVFRHAIRTTLAMVCGYAVAESLPYATHSYWVMLTIAVIMRSSFSLTRQRRLDRIMGNVAGCILTAVLLHFHPPQLAVLGVLFMAVAIVHTFATIQYRYASTAACVMALLQLHFISPGSFAIGERLLDTLVGAALAFAFSYLFPNWEHMSLPRQIAGLLRANRRYAGAILGMEATDAQYRLARKQLLDLIAIVSGAYRRMLQEPRNQHRASAQLQEFITRNYMFAAHLAALRLLLQRRGGELGMPLSAAQLREANASVQTVLTAALTPFAADAAAAGASAGAGKTHAPEVLDDNWSAARLLDRRLGLILDEASEIRDMSVSVAQAL
ncbi:MAG: FUSC family protein [Candidatus Protistobacter heckmanni]|nr:FUSC family protein [Candidatus Protistobacter heckmanni]